MVSRTVEGTLRVEQRIVGKKPVKAQIAPPNNFMFFLLPNYVFYLNLFFWLITKIKWNSKHFLCLYTSHLFKRKKKRFKKVDLVYTWKVFTWAFHVEEKTCILFERKRKQCMQVINKLLGSPLKITSISTLSLTWGDMRGDLNFKSVRLRVIGILHTIC